MPPQLRDHSSAGLGEGALPLSGTPSRAAFARPAAHSSRAAFTLIEVLVSAVIVILIGLSVVPAMLLLNTNTMAARLTTMASLIALNQVALVSTDAPFSPPDGQIPVDLALGEQTAPVIIYDDPNWDHSVNGTMTTKVEAVENEAGAPPLHLRRVTVTVEYNFRNKDYSVVMHTIRASDV